MAPEEVGVPGRRRRSEGRPAQVGMTLVEILVVAAIAAILLAVAVPAYQGYIQRGHRADAVRAMLGAAACQERVRAGSGYYDTTRCTGGLDTAHYVFSMEPPDQAATLAFNVVATPVRADENDRCGILYLDQAGTRRTSGDPERATACWNGK